MCYLFYLIALLIGLLYPTYLATSSSGLPFAALWDTISFMMTIGASFFSCLIVEIINVNFLVTHLKVFYIFINFFYLVFLHSRIH